MREGLRKLCNKHFEKPRGKMNARRREDGRGMKEKIVTFQREGKTKVLIKTWMERFLKR